MEEWAAECVTLIEDCEARESRLDDWQRQFIDSIRRQLERGQRLTRQQQEKLDEVWEHATARG